MQEQVLSILFITLFLLNLICGGFCSHVANAKNLNGVKWGFGGLLFGIIALIAVAGMPEKKSSI